MKRKIFILIAAVTAILALMLAVNAADGSPLTYTAPDGTVTGFASMDEFLAGTYAEGGVLTVHTGEHEINKDGEYRFDVRVDDKVTQARLDISSGTYYGNIVSAHGGRIFFNGGTFNGSIISENGGWFRIDGGTFLGTITPPSGKFTVSAGTFRYPLPENASLPELKKTVEEDGFYKVVMKNESSETPTVKNGPISFRAIKNDVVAKTDYFQSIDEFLAAWTDEYIDGMRRQSDMLVLIISEKAGDTVLDFGERYAEFNIVVASNVTVESGHYSSIRFTGNSGVINGGSFDFVEVSSYVTSFSLNGGSFKSGSGIGKYLPDGMMLAIDESGYYTMINSRDAALMYTHSLQNVYFTSAEAFANYDYPADITVKLIGDVPAVYGRGRNFTLDLMNKSFDGDIIVEQGRVRLTNVKTVTGRVIEKAGGTIKLTAGTYAYIEDSGVSIDDLLDETAAFPAEKAGWYKNSMGNVRTASNVTLVNSPFNTFYVKLAYHGFTPDGKIAYIQNNIVEAGKKYDFVPSYQKNGSFSVDYSITGVPSWTNVTFTKGVHTVTASASYRGYSRSYTLTVRCGNVTTSTFTDVRYGDWYHDAVLGVVNKGLFNGTSATEFSPDMPMSRAMILTVLYRMDKNAWQINGGCGFDDVSEYDWYIDGVQWAVYDSRVAFHDDVFYEGGLFDGNRAATREELAVYMYRMAKYMGIDTSGASGTLSATDADKVSDWAREAVSWMMSSGLMVGNPDGTFDPQGGATRAQIAVVIGRFYNMIG